MENLRHTKRDDKRHDDWPDLAFVESEIFRVEGFVAVCGVPWALIREHSRLLLLRERLRGEDAE